MCACLKSRCFGFGIDENTKLLWTHKIPLHSTATSLSRGGKRPKTPMEEIGL